MNDTPEYLSLSAAMATKDADDASRGAAQRLREVASVNGGLVPMEGRDGFRTFLAPTHPNTRFLVKPGKIQTIPYMAGAPMGVQSMAGRDGDVWLRFVNGIASTDNEEEIAWLEAHSGDPQAHADYHNEGSKTGACVALKSCKAPIGLCREQGPGIEAWAELKTLQQPTAKRAATLSPEIDVDALVGGGYSARHGGDEAKRMAALLENGNNARRERQYGQR